jgi:cell division protein FtsB
MTSSIGINWYLKLTQKIEFLHKKVSKLSTRNKFLEKKLRRYRYENNNIRTTRNGEDNHVVELSGRVHSARG